VRARAAGTRASPPHEPASVARGGGPAAEARTPRPEIAALVHERRRETPGPAETPGGGRFGRMSVRFEDPSPRAPGPGFDRADLPLRHAGLLERLDEAFGGRPVWSTLALRNTLGVSRESLRETLPFIAYKFRDGPWKGLWTRFGFDPRTRPEARELQVYPIAMERGDLSAVRGTPGGARVRKSDHMLSVPPWRTFTLLQLTDVDDNKLQKLLRRTKSTAVCDPKTGWLSPQSWQRVRACMEQRLRDVIDDAVAASPPRRPPPASASRVSAPATRKSHPCSTFLCQCPLSTTSLLLLLPLLPIYHLSPHLPPVLAPSPSASTPSPCITPFSRQQACSALGARSPRPRHSPARPQPPTNVSARLRPRTRGTRGRAPARERG
jgi:hypothetical protein